MLSIPEGGSSTGFLLGIDPGTQKLGIGIIEFDLITGCIVGVNAYTLNAAKIASSSWIEEMRSPRAMRLSAFEDNLTRIFKRVEPVAFACESPFFNSLHPGAFEALVECVCAIKKAIWRFDVWKAVEMIDPMSVKKAVGASFNAKKSAGKTRVEKKREVHDAIVAHPLLQVAGIEKVKLQDEHAIDALAVCLYLYFLYFPAQKPPLT